MIKPATFIARPRIGRPMREEEALAALERLGPTRKEAKAYLVLVRHGPSTASEVSHLLGVQYPAVYRVLHSLQGNGWIEATRDRPNRYRARNPRVVAEQARQAHADELGTAAEQIATLAEEYTARTRSLEADLYLYKGPETADGPRGVHPDRIAIPARAAPGHPPRAHVRLPERPGALHPELVLPRRLPGPREAPGPLDRGRGLRAPPARGDGAGTRRGAPAEGAGAPEGLTRAHAFARSLSYFPARISEMTSFGLFPSAVTPIETHVPTTSRTRPFTSF